MNIDGVGLHSGERVVVSLRLREGASTIEALGFKTEILGARVVDARRATTIAVGEARVSTVEHLLSALAAYRVFDGVGIVVEGPELPLLDGGARVWCRALRELGVENDSFNRARAPRLVVARDEAIEVDGSIYRFARGSNVEVRAVVDFGDPRIAADASWNGDSSDFEERIAPARTFAFERELEELASEGLASHVDRASVIVIAPDVIHVAGAPYLADEPARHKLLDLIGDLFLYGGPPLGSLVAFRPGHRATHAAMDRAIQCGIVVRS